MKALGERDRIERFLCIVNVNVQAEKVFMTLPAIRIR